MAMEKQVLSPDPCPFKIRHFVSTIRGQDFSRCWPFSHRILERCLVLGMKVELPPLDSPSSGYDVGSCNNTSDILFKCSTKAESCDFYNGSDHRQSASMKLAEFSRILADSGHMELCGTDAVNLAEINASFTNKPCLLFAQSLDDAAAVKLPTGSFWDDNAVSLSTANSSISSSQMVVEAKAELRDYDGVNLTGNSGCLHVATDGVAVIKEPNYGGLFQVAKEEGFIAAIANHSSEPHITQMGLLTQDFLSEIRSSSRHEKVFAGSRSPPVVHKPVPQLAECEEYIYKREKNKNAVDVGLLRSNSDASMPQICPVCLKFSSSSNTALNAHIDHCLVVDESNTRPSKKRFKIRKLRSMVDIYATAPTRTLEDLERSSQAWFLHKI